jgi:hypothetical protein
MASHNASTTAVIVSIGNGKWSATTDTPNGPLTAIGDSLEEAKVALDSLLAVSRAVEVTRRHAGSL